MALKCYLFVQAHVCVKERDIEAMYLFQDKCYPMSKPNLGHAVIINNVAKEFPGTKVDVEELQTTYQIMGFQVHVHNNCDDKVACDRLQVLKQFCTFASQALITIVVITIICLDHIRLN